FTAEMIPERAPCEQECGKEERVSFDDPLHVDDGRVETGLQRGKRDVDDRAIDKRHAGAKDGGSEYPCSGRFRAGSFRLFRLDYSFIAGLAHDAWSNDLLNEKLDGSNQDR